MTAQPQQHCDHECVCGRYQLHSIPYLSPCIANTNAELYESCRHDTRSRPSPKPEDATGFWFTPEEMRQLGTAIATQAREDFAQTLLKYISPSSRAGGLIQAQLEESLRSKGGNE